jgi:hypothetical protein
MWAKLLQTVLTSVVIPLLKDLAFMLWNMFKVRQIRKEREEKAKKAVSDYEKNPSDENYGNLP